VKINKKGYTLIELIMIITIMGLVMIIVFPSVMSMQNKNKKKEYEYYKDTVEVASKLYFDSHGEDMTSKYWHGCVSITYQDLVNANLLKPFAKEGITCNESKVYVSKNEDKVDYYPYIKCRKTSNNEVVYESSPYPGASCSLTIEDAPDVMDRNPNILNIYKYDQTIGSSTFCVTGEESTCLALKTPETYSRATIIRYRLNDTLERYFHVMYDNGNTLTLQQRENTVNSVAWYKDAMDNRRGPVTALAALETATSGWSNVLDQTYTLGTTVFKDNANTGCDYYEMKCRGNQYTLGQRTAKARMITFQEAMDFGCGSNARSCPVWMHNYLANCTDRGGTVNQGPDKGYWTSNAIIYQYTLSYLISDYGYIHFQGPNDATVDGVRAVIMVEK